MMVLVGHRGRRNKEREMTECTMTDGTHQQPEPGRDMCPPCEQYLLSTMTPAEIDERLAVLHGEYDRAMNRAIQFRNTAKTYRHGNYVDEHAAAHYDDKADE